MNYEDNPNSIKYYVKQFILRNKTRLKGKKIVDFPAGGGITSRILREVGAYPLSYDLFPEFFKIDGLKCDRANIAEGIPLEDNHADGLICQEGMEHFSDQLSALKEFNRILKHNAMLLITTPNYSNLRSKMSYLLGETERFNARMAPNELDSIWMSNKDNKGEIYYGHIFLIGIQKLRVLAKIAGFRIKKYHFTKTKSTSVALFPFLYPWILLSNWITYKKNMKKNTSFDEKTKKEVYGEIFKLAINPRILCGGNMMV